MRLLEVLLRRNGGRIINLLSTDATARYAPACGRTR
jgi:hypothetical protein